MYHFRLYLYCQYKNPPAKTDDDKRVLYTMRVDRIISCEELDEKTEKYKLDDEVKINFEGFVDGEAFEGGKGEDYALTLGSHSFIDTFEDQIVGKSIDDEFDVNVTFPEEYQAEKLAGKPAVFKVKLLGITETQLPELDDDYASDVSADTAQA